MTAEEHRRMIETGFDEVDIEDLVDVSGIRVDKDLPLEERKEQYVKRAGNPYMVRVGGIKVKVGFTGNISFDEAFENLLLSM